MHHALEDYAGKKKRSCLQHFIDKDLRSIMAVPCFFPNSVAKGVSVEVVWIRMAWRDDVDVRFSLRLP